MQVIAAPPTVPGIPPGLEYLAQIDQLLCHQAIELLEGVFNAIVLAKIIHQHYQFILF